MLFGEGKHSTHFVKQQTTTISKYLFPLEDLVTGLIQSIQISDHGGTVPLVCKGASYLVEGS